MNTESLFTVNELALTELHARAARARDALRAAGLRVGHAGALEAIDEALDEVARLLPGLSDEPRTLLARTIRDLAPHERGVLRAAIEAERGARDRLARILGCVAPGDAEEALARVEAAESVASELLSLLRLFEQTYRATRAALV
jgi:hypothetical protein